MARLEDDPFQTRSALEDVTLGAYAGMPVLAEGKVLGSAGLDPSRADAIANYLRDLPRGTQAEERLRDALSLVLSSPEFARY